jgi:hypothetical protein
MPGRHERASRAAMRNLVRTVGEPHRATVGAGGVPRWAGGAVTIVGCDDGKAPIDHWAVLTGGFATDSSGWRGDYEAYGSGGILIAEY